MNFPLMLRMVDITAGDELIVNHRVLQKINTEVFSVRFFINQIEIIYVDRATNSAAA